jgi:hypothetical protein
VLLAFGILIAATIIYGIYQSKHPTAPDPDGLGRVLGEATTYDLCPLCATKTKHLPRGTGEVIVRGGFYVVRQYHVCPNCGARALWHRRLDKWVWTINRSGVSGGSYASHG